MKLPILYFFCYAAVLLSACSKQDSSQPTPPTTNAGKTVVKLQLGGELSTEQSALPNARAAQSFLFARTLQDSTIYAVDVRVNGNQPYAAGLFNNLDSLQNLQLSVDKGATYTFIATAIKKGSGPGLWYQFQDGQQYFDFPFKRILDNKISYHPTDPDFLTDLSYMETFYQDTTKLNPYLAFYPEVDTYAGTASLDISSDTVPALTIPMKRAVFGIRFQAVNFTGGNLIVKYSNEMQSKSYTTETINNSLSIYTMGAYTQGDTYTSWETILFTVKWLKPDGTLVNIGDKTIMPPARNFLTTIIVTLPTTATTINDHGSINITETDWNNVQNVNF